MDRCVYVMCIAVAAAAVSIGERRSREEDCGGSRRRRYRRGEVGITGRRMALYYRGIYLVGIHVYDYIALSNGFGAFAAHARNRLHHDDRFPRRGVLFFIIIIFLRRRFPLLFG